MEDKLKILQAKVAALASKHNLAAGAPGQEPSHPPSGAPPPHGGPPPHMGPPSGHGPPGGMGRVDMPHRGSVDVPTHRFPSVNFVGLFIGRASATQRELEQRFQIRFSVRGEPLQVLISAVSPEALENAQRFFEQVMSTEAEIDKFRQHQRMQQGGPPPRTHMRAPPPGGASDTMTVPVARVGLVIGRAGDTIRRIQSLTNTNIDVDSSTNVGNVDRVFVIQGLPDDVAKAKRMMEEIVQGQSSTEPTVGLPDEMGVCVLSTGECQIQMEATASEAGLIIGRAGSVIRDLQMRYHSQIQVVTPEGPESSRRIVKLTGVRDAILALRNEINGRIQHSLGRRQQEMMQGGPGGYPGGPMDANQYRGPARHGLGMQHGHGQLPRGAEVNLTVFYVPGGSVGLIIGRAGDMIRRLRAETGANVQVIKTAEGGGPDVYEKVRRIEVRGNAAQAELMRRRLLKLVQQFSRNHGVKGEEMFRIEYPPSWRDDAQELAAQLGVPPEDDEKVNSMPGIPGAFVSGHGSFVAPFVRQFQPVDPEQPDAKDEELRRRGNYQLQSIREQLNHHLGEDKIAASRQSQVFVLPQLVKIKKGQRLVPQRGVMRPREPEYFEAEEPLAKRQRVSADDEAEALLADATQESVPTETETAAAAAAEATPTEEEPKPAPAAVDDSGFASFDGFAPAEHVASTAVSVVIDEQ
ncbi:MAG: hypothetical protein MHM6MM_005361 [Cercozoa sp. M6MM]